MKCLVFLNDRNSVLEFIYDKDTMVNIIVNFPNLNKIYEIIEQDD